jgi:hypothetical protein
MAAALSYSGLSSSSSSSFPMDGVTEELFPSLLPLLPRTFFFLPSFLPFSSMGQRSIKTRTAAPQGCQDKSEPEPYRVYYYICIFGIIFDVTVKYAILMHNKRHFLSVAKVTSMSHIKNDIKRGTQNSQCIQPMLGVLSVMFQGVFHVRH